ncbi:TPA: phosphatase PAP2 family protein [Candidatus Woesearchaeota archaeon]|nr:phosphatase PAP2 family protein [Candidatus Woesearchaeota archaeon]
MPDIASFAANNPVLIMILLTIVPFLELRASILYGIFSTNLHWSTVFLVCVITNILLGPVLYFFLDKIMHIFLRVRWIHKLYTRIVERPRKKIHEAVEKYGTLGVAVFIGIPLPGTGTYSAAIGSYLLNLGYKRFFIANIFGVLIAGTIMTLGALSGSSALSFIPLIDTKIALGITSIQTQALTVVMKLITHAGNIVSILLIALIIYLSFKEKRKHLKTALLGIIASAAITYLLKLAIARPRPFESLQIAALVQESSKTSFPSGHATTAFALFASINRHFTPKVTKYSFLAFAILVSFSRLYLGVHYLSDIIFGALLGYSVSYLILKLEANKKLPWEKK